MKNGRPWETDLVVRKIAMFHDDVHVSYTPRDWTRGVGDIWRLTLNIKVNALGTDATRASDGTGLSE